MSALTAARPRPPGSITVPELPALVSGQLVHHRLRPIRYSFRHRLHQWLIDLDDVPRQPWLLRPLARFDARDHFAGGGAAAEAPIKAKVLDFLAAQGIDLGPGHRVLMLGGARVLGHLFDPLTVFWCLDGGGALRCVVAEVHNTYGERHAYLLRPDERGRASTDKDFYVSPFFDVSGSYRLRFALGRARVAVTVGLDREGERVFNAGFSGRPAPATRRALLHQALRHPLMPQRVSALIRWHGIRLWLRRLPLMPRPSHHPQKGF